MRLNPVELADAGDGKVSVSATCRECGTRYASGPFDRKKVESVLDGRAHVQDALPEMPKGDRELYFISGICDRCWREMFGE